MGGHGVGIWKGVILRTKQMRFATHEWYIFLPHTYSHTLQNYKEDHGKASDLQSFTSANNVLILPK